MSRKSWMTADEWLLLSCPKIWVYDDWLFGRFGNFKQYVKPAWAIPCKQMTGGAWKSEFRTAIFRSKMENVNDGYYVLINRRSCFCGMTRPRCYWIYLCRNSCRLPQSVLLPAWKIQWKLWALHCGTSLLHCGIDEMRLTRTFKVCRHEAYSIPARISSRNEAIESGSIIL